MGSPINAVDAAGDAVRSVIRAFHGSPNPTHFNKFDPKFIGAGEGARAFGLGHYSAQRQGVADGYRQALSYRKFRDDFLNNLDEQADGQEVLDSISVFDPRQQRFLRELAEADWLGFDYPSQAISQSLGRQSGFAGYDVPESLHSAREQLGTGYELEIQHPESSLLDWDAPIYKQPDVVLNALDRLGMPTTRDSSVAGADAALMRSAYGTPSPGALSGSVIYKVLGNSQLPVSEAERYRAASERLLSAGVPGIRYLDQGSRHSGPSGTRNYVMFPGTEDSIRILRKYGIVPPTVGAALSQQQQEGSTAPGVAVPRQ